MKNIIISNPIDNNIEKVTLKFTRAKNKIRDIEKNKDFNIKSDPIRKLFTNSCDVKIELFIKLDESNVVNFE